MSRIAGLGLAAALAALLPLSAAETQAASHPQRTPEPAAAAKPVAPGTETLGQADSWAAYASQDKTGRICYIVSQPKRSDPAGAARKSPMAMVTHRPAEKITNVVSFVEGYPLKEGSEVSLDLGGGNKFELFTKDDSAWARTSDTDKAIVTAMLKSRQALVRGTPQRGAPTSDTYALVGFGKALSLIDKACGIKRDETSPPIASTAPVPATPAHKHVTHRKTRQAHHAKPPRQAAQQATPQ